MDQQKFCRDYLLHLYLWSFFPFEKLKTVLRWSANLSGHLLEGQVASKFELIALYIGYCVVCVENWSIGDWRIAVRSGWIDWIISDIYMLTNIYALWYIVTVCCTSHPGVIYNACCVNADWYITLIYALKAVRSILILLLSTSWNDSFSLNCYELKLRYCHCITLKPEVEIVNHLGGDCRPARLLFFYFSFKSEDATRREHAV